LLTDWQFARRDELKSLDKHGEQMAASHLSMRVINGSVFACRANERKQTAERIAERFLIELN
jgi:hypothetical protein